MRDLIERKAAIDEALLFLVEYCGAAFDEDMQNKLYQRLILLPSAQPEMNFDEWCTDCKEYDQERHCCPRFNRVIRNALKDAQPEPQWIPCSEMLPESKPEDLEYPTVIACCEDGEVMTACYYESTKEWGTGENYDKKINPVAWMPLPKPYRAERRTDGRD